MGHTRSKALGRIGILTGVLDRISDAQLETLDVVTDVNQMTHLLTSLLEARSGQVVSLSQAFADIQ